MSKLDVFLFFTVKCIVKLPNQKDSQYISEEKYKLMNIMLYDYNESKNSNRTIKIFINESLCLYYRKLNGL